MQRRKYAAEKGTNELSEKNFNELYHKSVLTLQAADLVAAHVNEENLKFTHRVEVMIPRRKIPCTALSVSSEMTTRYATLINCANLKPVEISNINYFLKKNRYTYKNTRSGDIAVASPNTSR